MEEQETQLQKYEADIRQHISIEQQLQVYIDGLKQKIEDSERDFKWLQKDLDEKDAEVALVTREGNEALEALKVDHSIELDRINE